MLKEIYSFAREGRRYTIAAAVLLSIASIAGLLAYYAAYGLVTPLIEGNLTAGICLGMSGLAGLGLVLKHLLTQLGLKASHHVAYNTLAGMRRHVTKKLLNMPLGSVDAWGSGALKKVFVENIEEMELILAHGIPEGIGNMIGLAAAVAAIFIVDWRLALLCLAVMPLGFGAILLMNRGAGKKLSLYYQSSREMNETIIEYVRGMKEIKIFGQGESAFRRYRSSVQNYKKFTLDWYKNCWKYMSFYDVVLPTTLLFVLPAGTKFYFDGGISVPSLVFCLLLALSIGPLLARVVMFLPMIPNLLQKYKPIKSLYEEHELLLQDTQRVPEQYTVQFEKVSFAYQKAQVLKQVSFTAKPGTVTAIVGSSGAGKSTVAKLLCRFWDVQEGAVNIGGHNIRCLSFSVLMDAISYVSQDNFLFDLSILENLRLGNPGADDETVQQAAKRARCHDFIMELSDGYDTLVGEAGGRLSGGQRQRLTIARAILKNAPIVVLDEATSATDAENEDLIQEALNVLLEGKTVIVIAHRLSTITGADNIIYMKNGCIHAHGTHDALLKTCEEYAGMWKAYNHSSNWLYDTNRETGEVEAC